MKKLLYVSFENSENRASGVNKKINGQIKAFEGEGYSVDLIAHYQSNIAFYHGEEQARIIESGLPWRIELCNWAANHASDYNVAYIRFQFFCPFVLNMVRSFHKAGVKTVMEIPTYPYVPELKKQGTKGALKRLVDGAFRRACAKYIDRFTAPLYGDPIMGKPCIEIRNGIEVNEIQARQVREPDGKIHLLAVAMMAPWHGYDRMIEGIHKYYLNGGKREIILHLVGEGAATPVYQKLIEEYSLGEHVIQHGRKFGKELDSMYDIADVGVGALASFTKQIYKTNTLKVLEYMAKGLPVICEEGEVGIPKDSKYRLTITADESPVDMNSVVEFYDLIYGEVDQIETVINDIKNYCIKNCSVEDGMRDLFIYLNSDR